MYATYHKPTGHTQAPVNIGNSVIALKYKDGVMIGADTNIAFGSMKHSKGVSRMAKVGEETVIASGGEMSDFQEVMKMLN